MRLILTRDYSSTDCTQGKLTLLDWSADTMERPWVPIIGGPCGKKGVSCIPAGTYKLVRHNSEAHPKTWALVNPDLWVYHWDEDAPQNERSFARTLVLIHPANWPSELRGCIAPGLDRALDDKGRRMVTHSRLAMDALQARLPWEDGHELEIRNEMAMV